MSRISRRHFIQRTLLSAAGLGSGWALGACAPTPAPTSPPRPTSTPIQPTAAAEQPTPTAVRDTPTPSATAGLGVLPDAPSRVVRAQNAGVWQDGELDPAVLRQMLDTSLARLTGIDDAGQAWRSLFKPGERVAIKVNSIVHGSTHLALVAAIVERLQDAGIRPEQIALYDRSSQELADSGFMVNRSGSGVRCLGTDGDFIAGWQVNGTPVRLCRVLAECDALINIPILKAFTLGGISFAMKNHYGSVENPSRFHDRNFAPGITGLNALQPIRDRTRLIVGDVVTAAAHQDWTNYVVVGGMNTILMSTDPVAHDRVGLQIAEEALGRLGLDLLPVTALASEWLQAGAAGGLGIQDLDRIDVAEVSI